MRKVGADLVAGIIVVGHLARESTPTYGSPAVVHWNSVHLFGLTTAPGWISSRVGWQAGKDLIAKRDETAIIDCYLKGNTS